MPHHRARFTARGREVVVRRVEDDGQTFAQAAAWANVSTSTVWAWVAAGGRRRGAAVLAGLPAGSPEPAAALAGAGPGRGGSADL